MIRTCTVRNPHDSLSYVMTLAWPRLSIHEARDATMRIDRVAPDQLLGWAEAAFDDRDLFAFFEVTEAAWAAQDEALWACKEFPA